MTDWGQLLQAASLPGGGWVPAWRKAAMTAFTAAGMPRQKAEVWKNTPLRALSRAPFDLVRGDTPSSEAAPIDQAARIVLIDGAVASSEALPEGVTLTPVASALIAADDRVRFLSSVAPAAINAPFDQLNAALLCGGVVIEVAANVQAGAIHLVHTSTGGAHSARHTRHVVTVAQGAEITLIEHFVGGPGLHSVVTDLFVGDNAEVNHVVVQQHADEALHLANQRVAVDRNGRYRGVSIAIGGVWTRTGIHVDLIGSGAEARLAGAYLGRDKQHHDHTVRVDHTASHGTSDQRYRGILTDRSRGVFSSLVAVGPKGTKADGTQDNRNLLLSDTAHADSEPQLEIYTDDVKAAHGSAIGKLDEDALFYLRARGIDRRTARRMMTGAFAHEIVSLIRHEGAREAVSAAVDAWLQDAVR